MCLLNATIGIGSSKWLLNLLGESDSKAAAKGGSQKCMPNNLPWMRPRCRFHTVHLFDFGETRLRTGYFGDVYYELGAMAFCNKQKYISTLVKELKLKTHHVDAAHFFWNGQIVSREDIGKQKHTGIGDMSYEEITQTYLTASVWEKREKSPSSEELDQLSARALLEQNAPKEVADFYEYDLFGTIAAPGLRSVSALQVVQYLRANFELQDDTETGFMQITGGNEQIIHAYKKLIKDKHPNVEWHSVKVTKIEKEIDGYKVLAADAFENGMNVDEIVVCTPLHALPEMVPAINLPPVPYIAHLRVYLHLRQRFWGTRGTLISNDAEIGWVADHTFNQNADSGILELHLCGQEAENLGESGKTKDEMAEEAIRRLSKIWPEIAEKDMLLGVDVKYWPHAISYFPPGTRQKYLKALQACPIWLCGEHTGHQVGSLNGAMKAAVDVCALIRAS